MSHQSLFMAGIPRYRCRKVVHALKIAAAEVMEDGTVKLAFEGGEFGPLVKSADWGKRFKPFHGDADGDVDPDPGYLVIYEDGYESWSPTKAFEAGYRRINEDASWKERVAEEREELADKVQRLRTFLYVADIQPVLRERVEEKRRCLLDQLQVMERYLEILDARLEW